MTLAEPAGWSHARIRVLSQKQRRTVDLCNGLNDDVRMDRVEFHQECLAARLFAGDERRTATAEQVQHVLALARRVLNRPRPPFGCVLDTRECSQQANGWTGRRPMPVLYLFSIGPENALKRISISPI